ncbi:MAG TPA: oxygenase MpaB family protein [Acidimicrobiales bacterium]|nr:oxygenase MpaB family protein [Acidimicrobiales bacterium]
MERAERGVHPDAILGPDSVSARVLGHPAVLLGGPRALLLQIVHPSVAAGVVDHSNFDVDPYRRLARTFEVMHAIAFGSPAISAGAAAGLAAVHRRVTGTTAGGEPYAAGDPDLALWVHATLVDTSLAVEQRYIGELDEDGRTRYYDESRRLGPALGLDPASIPPDLGAFRAYVAAKEAELLQAPGAPGADARRIARSVLNPPPTARLGPLAPLSARAAARLVRTVTVDLGPPALCRAFGLPERLDFVASRSVVSMVAAVSKLASPRLPGAVRDPGTLVRLTGRLAEQSR